LTPAQLAWLRTNAVELATVEAGHGFAELQPLKAMIGSARVVGLGEGTHGTREYFQAKHRLLEFLATEMGFTLFSIEANMPEAYALNDYVLGGPGDVEALIAGMYFWTWNTEEVRDMVEWMRAFNSKLAAEGSTDRVQFTGFDMQTGKVAIDVVRKFIAAHDPEYRAEAAPALDALAGFNPHLSGNGDFGCATGRFPVEDARGRTVRFSGWIKTEGVDDAWAGLWWRVDGPSPSFDNMMDRGPRGTTEWTQVAIEVAVPENAQAIYFGLVKPGSGKAWFDSLTIEIDGKPWSNPEMRGNFDFDFEGPQPEGIIAADPMRNPPSLKYPGSLDRRVAKSGASSFLLAPRPPKVVAGGGFGCATGRFPVEDARGRTIRFSGWIRTEELDDAWAGLWWRVDGPSPRFDNMMERGPRGTTDWQQVTIEMEVPMDARAIYFGLLNAGIGKAWFDSLTIEIDGKPWSNPEVQRNFDFDFEGPQPEGIIAADPMRNPPSKAFPGALDRTVARSGASSFLLAPTELATVLEVGAARAQATSIHDHLVASRERYAGTVDAQRVEWAIQNARLIQQWIDLGSASEGGSAHRDRCMAENVSWILAQNQGARMVIWAHNWHVRDEAPWMGAHLRRSLGKDYVNLAFCASHGEYGAIAADRGAKRVHALAAPPAQSVEAILESAGRPILLVDLRRAVAGEPGSGWLADTRLFGGVIGALAMPEHYSLTTLKGPFDLLIYLRNTTAARPLR